MGKRESGGLVVRELVLTIVMLVAVAKAASLAVV